MSGGYDICVKMMLLILFEDVASILSSDGFFP